MTEFVSKDAAPVMPVIFERTNVVPIKRKPTVQMFEVRTEQAKPKPRIGQPRTSTQAAVTAQAYIEACENRQRQMLVSTSIQELVRVAAHVPEPSASILYSPLVRVSRRQCGFLLEECAGRLLGEAISRLQAAFSRDPQGLTDLRASIARIAPYAPASARRASIQLDGWEAAGATLPA